MPTFSSGPNSPGTMADDSSVGASAWGTPNNAKVNDAVFSDVSLTPGQQSHYLKATNFGFSLPAGVTIAGVVVEVEQKGEAVGKLEDTSVKLVKNGTIGGTDHQTDTRWPTTEAYATYGTSSDLWGLTISSSDVNASDFGVVIQAQNDDGGNTYLASVDHIRITVYYTTFDYTLTADQGASTFTGQDLTLSKQMQVVLDFGSFVFTGFDILFDKFRAFFSDSRHSSTLTQSNRTSATTINQDSKHNQTFNQDNRH